MIDPNGDYIWGIMDNGTIRPIGDSKTYDYAMQVMDEVHRKYYAGEDIRLFKFVEVGKMDDLR